MSRYPDFSPNYGYAGQQRAPEMRQSPAAFYDQSLLTNAPTITKADRQQGYDIDILERQPTNNSSGRTVIKLDDPGYGANNYSQSSYAAAPLPPFEQADSLQVRPWTISPPPLTDPFKRPTPLWRTKKGLIVIGVAFLVVVGIVVGIAVGITTRSKSNNGGTSDSVNAPLPSLGSGTEELPSGTLSNPNEDALATATQELGNPPLETVPVVPPPTSTIRVGGGDDEDTAFNGDDDGDDELVSDPVGDIEAPEEPEPGVPQPTSINGGGGGTGNNAGGGQSTSTRPAICNTFPNIPACRG